MLIMENPFEIILDKLASIENRLKVIEETVNSKNKNTESTLMDTKELSTYLKLTIPTIYDKVYKREIPHLKVSNKLYFMKDDIDNWLMKGRVLDRTEIDSMAEKYIMENRI